MIDTGETRSAPQQLPDDVPGLPSLIDWIRTAAALLPSYSPDPSEGPAWIHFDSALSSLYRALADLDELRAPRSGPESEQRLITAR